MIEQEKEVKLHLDLHKHFMRQTNKLMEKFKNIEAISMGSHESLVISFHGFTDRDEVKEFADYIFAKIKMSYHSLEKPPTIH